MMSNEFTKAQAYRIIDQMAVKAGWEDLIAEIFTRFFSESDVPELVKIFGVDICDLYPSDRELRESEELYRQTLNSISDSVFLTDGKGDFIFVCPNVELTFGFTQKEVAALSNIAKLFGENLYDEAALEVSSEIRNIERSVPDKQGKLHTLLINVKKVTIKGASLLFVCRDITERKQMEEELRIKTEKLEDMNATLRVLLNRREDDKREIGENVLLNIRDLVMPTINSLKMKTADRRLLAELELVESNLTEIVSPFSRALTGGSARLSPTELKLANYIKEGKTSKEAAELMHLSRQTIETYRKNIRKKLKISNKKENLRSYLLALQKPDI